MRFDQLTHADRYDLDQEGIGVPPAFCDNYSTAHAQHIYKAINGRMYKCTGITATELAELEARDKLTCEHGMSLDLCADPINHYPPDF